MPVQNLTVSPLDSFIIYAGNWTLNHTLSTAAAYGEASFNVSFYGTAIYVTGALLGNYSVVLDDGAPVYYPGTINNTLSSISRADLTPEHHTLTVDSQNDIVLLDMFVTSGDGNSSALAIEDSRIENDNPSVTYFLSNGSTTPAITEVDRTASGGSVGALIGPCVFSSIPCPQNALLSYVNISFHGNEVALYSLITWSTDSMSIAEQSGYSVSIDGAPPEIWPQRQYALNSQEVVLTHSNSLLYQRSGLQSGDHFIVLTPTNVSSSIGFDYAQSRTYSDNVQSSSSSPTVSATVTTTSLPARSTNVAAIAGGVVGGISLALILTATMFFVIRRRFRQARLIFVGANSLDPLDRDQPRRSEEDMAPPNYRHIFPSDSGGAEEQARAEGAARVDARPRGIWRIGRQRPGEGASIPVQSGFNPTTVHDNALPQAPVNRTITNASIWTWKGVPPPEQHPSVQGKGKQTSPLVGEILEK